MLTALNTGSLIWMSAALRSLPTYSRSAVKRSSRSKVASMRPRTSLSSRFRAGIFSKTRKR
jgi:hypothetical protein